MVTGQIIGIVGLCLIGLFIVSFFIFLFKTFKKRKADYEISKKKQQPANTKLICDFMGYSIWKPWIARFKIFDHTMVTTPFGLYDFEDIDDIFRSDWGWLHEITNKIGKIPFKTKDGMREWMAVEWSDAKINIHSTKKEVYDKIIQFIKWYND